MKSESKVAVAIAVIGAPLFTGLLIQGAIGQITYLLLLSLTAFIALVLHGFSRLKEMDVKNLKLTLNEAAQVKQQLDNTISKVTEMYGGIEKLRREPMVLDDKKMKELGLQGGHLTTAAAAMRYPAGCIKRERERLAQIFISAKSPEDIAKAILDNSLDDKVFKWNGPETPLDEPPESVQERKQKADDVQDDKSR